MTSLLTHDVTHSTRHSFRFKTNNQPFWLLILDLKEGLVEWATVCVKSEVILFYKDIKLKFQIIKLFTLDWEKDWVWEPSRNSL